MPSWETGRLKSGFGAKAGGLGSVIEELPEELVKAAANAGIDLHIEILTPCFAHYDRSKLSRDPVRIPVRLDNDRFEITTYRRDIDSSISVVYFWDELQLGWTNADSLYPSDPEMGFKLYGIISQAISRYIAENNFDSIHSHDYHLGIIPFFLGEEYLSRVPHHLTIHNATYQGIFPAGSGGPDQLRRIGLDREGLYQKYFELNGSLNFLRAASLITHETGGKVTTVSGDLKASWGYAAELKRSHEEILTRARNLKGGKPVGDVFVPNCGLDIFRDIGIIGITNGLSPVNRAENLPELKASVLRSQQEKSGGDPIFCNPAVSAALLGRDHNFGPGNLEVKKELKRLLHLELFGSEPEADLVFLVSVGRLASQKNFELIAATAERVMGCYPSVKFAIMANPPEGDMEARALQKRFESLKASYPDSFFYSRVFSHPHSRLILAGGDFALIPSRFEPCGLVDYEASALGTVVIGHNIGGLSKVAGCGYLYDWLDSRDSAGEAGAFFNSIREAVETFRENNSGHQDLVRAAMRLDSSWERSASTYIDMYLYGFAFRSWLAGKEAISRQVEKYAEKLFERYPCFPEFYHPASADLLETRMTAAVEARKASVSSPDGSR